MNTIYRFRNRWRPTDIIIVRASSRALAQLRLRQETAYPQDYDIIQTKEATVPPLIPLIHYRFTGKYSNLVFNVVATNRLEAEKQLKREHGRVASMYDVEVVPNTIPEPMLTISDDGKILTRTYADGKTEEMPINPDAWRHPIPTTSGIYVAKEQSVYVRYPEAWNGRHWMFQGNRIADSILPNELTLVHTF